MIKVAVLGAGGQIARHAVEMFADETDIEQTLFLRDAGRLAAVPNNARVLEGDVLDRERLADAIHGQDVVYANLAGDVDIQAERIVATMGAQGVQQLIFVTALGIYDEVPGAFGEWNRSQIGTMLKPGLDGDRDFVDLVGRMAGTRMNALDGICVRGLRQAEDVSGSGIGPGLHELHALVGLYVEIGLVRRSKRVSSNANHLCVNVHEPSHDQPPMVSTTPP